MQNMLKLKIIQFTLMLVVHSQKLTFICGLMHLMDITMLDGQVHL